MASSKIIPITELQPGMMVIQITAQNGPVRIKKSGIIPSYDMVKGLTEMGVQELEIDLDNSLDLAVNDDIAPVATAAPQTQTQQLFMQDQQRDVESSMSEQFNRSLFLPSLQALPSQWQVMGKQISLFVFVIMLGGVLGFGTAKGLVHLQIQSSNQEILTDNNTVPTALTPPVAETLSTPELSPEPIQDLPTEVSKPAQVTVIEPAEEAFTEPTELEGVILNAREENNVTISPEVAARLNKVLDDLGEPLPEAPVAVSPPPEQTRQTVNVSDNIPRIDQLSASILSRLPAMVFAAHMYSSNDADRWVRVNNRRLSEGDNIDNNVQIIKIEPQHVVLSFQGTEFRMNALSDW